MTDTFTLDANDAAPVMDAPHADAPIDTTATESDADAQRRRGIFGFFKKTKPVEVKLADVATREPREDRSVVQLKKGYNEIVDTMSAVRQHMEQQSERSEQMLDIMRQLPDALRSQTDSANAQASALHTIHDSLRSQNEQQTQLSSVLQHLADTTQGQEGVVTQIREELTTQRAEQSAVISGLSGTLGQVTAASQANTEAMRALARRAEHADQNTVELFERSRKQQTAIAVFSWAAAILLLVVAMWMFIELRGAG